MSYTDRRPWIRGLTVDDCFNLRRKWFKWDSLIHEWTRVQGYETGDFGYTDKEKMTEAQEAEVKLLGEFACFIEEVIMGELFEYGESLDSSLERMNSYIDGLLDSSVSVVQVTEEGQLDG